MAVELVIKLSVDDRGFRMNLKVIEHQKYTVIDGYKTLSFLHLTCVYKSKYLPTQAL